MHCTAKHIQWKHKTPYYERKTRRYEDYERTSTLYCVSTSFQHHHGYAFVIVIGVNPQANLITEKNTKR